MRFGPNILRRTRLAWALGLVSIAGCIEVADRDLSLATDGSPGGSVTDASPVGPPHDAASPGDAGDGSVPVGFDFQAPPGDTDADRPILLPDGGGGGGSDGGISPPGPDGGDPRVVLAPQNNYGPAARLIALEMPATPEAATAAGCQVEGRWNGTLLYSAFNFSGHPLSDYLHPNADGEIEVIILARAEGWSAGEPVSGADPIDLRLNTGRQTADLDAFEIDPDRRETLFSNTRVGADAEFKTDAATSEFMLPLVYGGSTPFTMQQSTIRGRLAIDGPGFGVRGGFIEGYFTKHDLIEALLFVVNLCEGPEPPQYCGLLTAFVNSGTCQRSGADVGCNGPVDLLVAVAGGFDVRLDEAGVPHACDPADCNAAGVCMTLEMEGTTITGLAMP